MKKINWKVRLENKTFWIAMIPAVLLLIQLIGSVFGIELNFGDLGNKLKEIVNVVFVILSLLGVVVDPTTEGVSDSDRAMTY